MEIIEGDFATYLSEFWDERTADSDFFVRQAVGTGGRVFLVAQDGQTYGYAVFQPSGHGRRLSYAYTRKEQRRRGIFTLLLQQGSSLAGCLHLGIAESHSGYAAVTAACRRLHFTKNTGSIIYNIDVEGSRPVWEYFMATKGNAMFKRLQRSGYQLCSFAEASPWQLEYLRNSHFNDYQNMLNPEDFFAGRSGSIAAELSFMALREGIPEAYTLVTCPSPGRLIFEHTSVAKRVRQRGFIFLPLVASATAIGRGSYQSIRYIMLENNSSAHALRKMLLAPLPTTSTKFHNYLSS